MLWVLQVVEFWLSVVCEVNFDILFIGQEAAGAAWHCEAQQASMGGKCMKYSGHSWCSAYSKHTHVQISRMGRTYKAG